MDAERESAVDVYETFAREEVADRGRLRASVCLALAVHALLLVLPWPRMAPGDGVTLPATAATPFRLQSFRFLPPQPPPEPTPPAPAVEEPPAGEAPPAEPEPPPRASAELLVPPGPVGSLLPPQPVSTPAPPVPDDLWRRGVGGEVVLTLLVDQYGQVVEIEREEGAQELADAARQTVRYWTFLPATLDGQPVATAVSVRVSFPAAASPAAPAGRD